MDHYFVHTFLYCESAFFKSMTSFARQYIYSYKTPTHSCILLCVFCTKETPTSECIRCGISLCCGLLMCVHCWYAGILIPRCTCILRLATTLRVKIGIYRYRKLIHVWSGYFPLLSNALFSSKGMSLDNILILLLCSSTAIGYWITK